MKKRLTLILLLGVLCTNARAAEPPACNPPYEPSNVIEATLRYSAAMQYITEGPEACSRAFAGRFIEVFRDSWLISDGCLKVTIEDVNAALEKRESIPRKVSRDVPAVVKHANDQHAFIR